MVLRDYQKEAQKRMRECYALPSMKNNFLITMPTGTGKSAVFTTFEYPDEHVLIITNRRVLLNQTAKYFSKENYCLLGDGNKSIFFEKKFFIVTWQTFSQEDILNQFSDDFFGTIIIDECHHASSYSYQKILKYFEYKNCFGFTATPDIESSFFNAYDPLYSYSLNQAWEDKVLVPLMPYLVKIDYNFSEQTRKKLKKEQGDLTPEEIDKALRSDLSNNFNKILSMYRVRGSRYTSIYFPTVALAEEFAQYCIRQGVMAATITANTTNREDIIAQFQENPTMILSSVDVLTEGIDIPCIENIFICRPTTSVTLYKQIVGRGLRLSPQTGKTCCNVIDFVDNDMNLIYQQTFGTVFLNLNYAQVIAALDESYCQWRVLSKTLPISQDEYSFKAVPFTHNYLMQDLIYFIHPDFLNILQLKGAYPSGCSCYFIVEKLDDLPWEKSTQLIVKSSKNILTNDAQIVNSIQEACACIKQAICEKNLRFFERTTEGSRTKPTQPQVEFLASLWQQYKPYCKAWSKEALYSIIEASYKKNTIAEEITKFQVLYKKSCLNYFTK